MTPAHLDMDKCMTIHLDYELPEYPAFEEGYRRAPRRESHLTEADKILAIKNALRYIHPDHHEQMAKEFAQAGANMITVHAEACVHLDRTLRLIREQGCQAGIALNPATPVETLEHVLELADMVLIMTVNPGFGGQKYISYCTEKIRRLRRLAAEKNPGLHIEVDGGINRTTIHEVLEAGANIIVAGSAVFNGDIEANARELKRIME